MGTNDVKLADIKIPTKLYFKPQPDLKAGYIL